MQIKEITLSRTYNLGNYESLRVELKAEIDEKEDVQKNLKILEKECNKYRDYKMS